MSQRFTFTFDNVEAYKECMEQVKEAGGTIVHDLGAVIMGFVASMTPALAQSIRSNSFAASGATIEEDKQVTTQPHPAE